MLKGATKYGCVHCALARVCAFRVWAGLGLGLGLNEHTYPLARASVALDAASVDFALGVLSRSPRVAVGDKLWGQAWFGQRVRAGWGGLGFELRLQVLSQ